MMYSTAETGGIRWRGLYSITTCLICRIKPLKYSTPGALVLLQTLRALIYTTQPE